MLLTNYIKNVGKVLKEDWGIPMFALLLGVGVSFMIVAPLSNLATAFIVGVLSGIIVAIGAVAILVEGEKK